MAIALRQGTKGYQNNFWSGTTLDIPAPAGTVENDVLIAFVNRRSNDADVATAPAGWILIDQVNDSNVSEHSCWYKVAGASEPATYTWTTTTASSSGIRCGGMILGFSGVSTSNPFDVPYSKADQYGYQVSRTPTPPNITTANDGSMVVTAVLARTGGGATVGSCSPPSGYNFAVLDHQSINKICNAAANDLIATAGAEQPGNWTLNNGVDADYECGMYTLALRDENAAPPSDTITLNDLEERRVYQRQGTSRTMTISGSYSGTPTAIEARIVDNGTTTPVVDWTTIDSSPSGGTFSGTLSVPEGGWYNVDVRYANDTGVTDEGTARWGVGILIGCIGQSNIQRWFTDGSGQTPNDTLSRHNFGWGALTANANGAASFGATLQAGLPSPLPIGFVDYAQGGTAIADWATPPHPNYDTFQTQVNNLGGELEIVLWSQGESDDGTSQAVYESELNALINTQTRNDFTNRGPVAQIAYVISELGTTTAASTDAAWMEIRNAHQNAPNIITNCFIGARKIDLPRADSFHLTPASYTTEGKRMAEAVLWVYGERANFPAGPSITSFQAVSGTQTRITISHDEGTDFTPVTGITGFEVLDNGTPVTISTAVRENATSILLTHTAVTGTRTARYQYGANPDITGAVMDNSALVLPLISDPDITEFVVQPITIPNVEYIEPVLDMAQVAACMTSEGWTISNLTADSMTINSLVNVTVFRADLENCIFPSSLPAPVYNDLVNCVQNQGFCPATPFI